MAVMHDNLNALAAILAPKRDKPEVNRVFSALARRAVEWPHEASKALDVPGLHLNVQQVLIQIAERKSEDRPVPSYMLASLRNRMDRYHPKWRD